jgi:hypothetical protein
VWGRDNGGVPIANCLVASVPDELDTSQLVAAWSNRSGVDPDEMTINLLEARQAGKPYAVMAWLYLPSIWSGDAVAALSEGLAAALADAFALDPSAVQVVTSIVASGLVVEDGEAVYW